MFPMLFNYINCKKHFNKLLNYFDVNMLLLINSFKYKFN